MRETVDFSFEENSRSNFPYFILVLAYEVGFAKGTVKVTACSDYTTYSCMYFWHLNQSFAMKFPIKFPVFFETLFLLD